MERVGLDTASSDRLKSTRVTQDGANTLWAYAKVEREPGARLVRVLEGRAEALADTFNAQEVANTLWAACVLAVLRAPDGGC